MGSVSPKDLYKGLWLYLLHIPLLERFEHMYMYYKGDIKLFRMKEIFHNSLSEYSTVVTQADLQKLSGLIRCCYCVT